MTRYSPIAFATAVLAFPILTLGFGLAGSKGSGPLTAMWLLAVSVILSATSLRIPRPTLTDLAFLAFAIFCLISTALSFEASHWKEYLLLAICVPAPYVAGRLMTVGQLNQVPRSVLMASAAFTVLSTVIIAVSLANNGLNGHNRTEVLGLAETQIVFSMALACLAISFVNSAIPIHSTTARLLLLLILFSTMVLVISLVRFTIIAMIVSLAFAAFVSAWQGAIKVRNTALAVCAACLLGTFAATALRPVGVTSYASEAVSDVIRETSIVADTKPGPEVVKTRADREVIPSCEQSITSEDRSVHVRAILLKDALFLLPRSGFFGFGLDSFPGLTCLNGGYQIHNIYLQTFIELGYLAGVLLLILVVSPLTHMRKTKIDHKRLLARNFLVTMLGFFCLLGLVHGGISRALPIFLLLGAISSFYADEGLGKDTSS